MDDNFPVWLVLFVWSFSLMKIKLEKKKKTDCQVHVFKQPFSKVIILNISYSLWFSWQLQKLPGTSHEHILVILKICHDSFNFYFVIFFRNKTTGLWEFACIVEREFLFSPSAKGTFSQERRTMYSLYLTHIATLVRPEWKTLHFDCKKKLRFSPMNIAS